MKKLFFIALGLFPIGLAHAQVGINTQFPQGILHIDGGGDTNGGLNISDDVVIDKYGNMGIGTINPHNKIEIISYNPGAIRIADGTEGTSKVLTSDSDGNASWVNIIGSWNASITGGNLAYTTTTGTRKINFTGGTISNSSVGNINITNGSITAPYTGTYRLTLFGTSLMNRANGYFIAGYYAVRKNTNNNIWAPHSLGHTLISPSPYVSYYSVTYLAKNDVLDVVSIEVSPGFANAVSNLTLFIEFIK